MSVAHEDHYGPWTVEEVLALGEDRGQRRELVGEALLLSPAPGTKHQRASFRLASLLDAAIASVGAPAEVLGAVNVILPDGLFIPDIAVVDAAAADQDPVNFDAEAVLLVAEIVSPSSSGRRTDRLLKPPYYAEAGIEHLWRLELEPTPALVVCELENGRYVERAVAEAGRTTLIEKPFPVEVDPGALVRRRR
ncbi:Uma2 family endonuclease [Streptomyces albofaciens JCM 4342]|uniref:Uma2 family endonuclease n=1 Tax=Streptomyces albofaciens TaxID=66866 RepID=UPI00123BC8CB|nr:Uma2 family endonuclease [Streptomyces albofaciens]KAA6214556.1 Uma2 family endonuclease [Streptomyces albofaciens JCM 4342]